MPTGIRKRGASYEASVYLKRESESSVARSRPSPARRRGGPRPLTAANKGPCVRRPRPRSARRGRRGTPARRPARSATARATATSRARSAPTSGAMRLRVLPEFGAAKLADVRRGDLQDLSSACSRRARARRPCSDAAPAAGDLQARAWQLGELAVNPTAGLDLPAVPGRPRPDRRPDRGGGPDRRRARRTTARCGRPRSTRACGAAS